ncbi:hypothetical protein HDU80_000104 [Chytriomyces hyalinus]|nr:hypothetical protein HDU80_000104 [Chytriomyces hyalinus]
MSLLRSMFQRSSQHTRWRFYSTATKKTESLNQMHKEIRVFCVLANRSDFRPLQIDIKSTAVVYDLKKAILAENINALGHVDATRLTLVMVFKEGVGGFTTTDIDKWKKLQSRAAYGKDPENAKDEISMFRNTPGACIQKEGVFFKVMNSIRNVSVYLDSVPDDLYYVLILAPRKTKLSRLEALLEDFLRIAQRTSNTPSEYGVAGVELESRAEKPAELIKRKDEMPALSQTQKNSANDGEAILKLQKIQSSNFERAVSKSGQEWRIPIADNVNGLEFARHYISKSREMWPDATKRDPFQQTLCSCHTVYVKFRKETLNQDSFDSAMLAYLKEALEPMFIKPPSMLAKEHKWAVQFLKDFTKVAGPVYIVLDEIENAFEGGDFNERDQFVLFCEKIVANWCYLPNVFFVVLGRASFLRQVAVRSIRMIGDQNFQRLNF